MIPTPSLRETALILPSIAVLGASGGDLLDDFAHGADRAHLVAELVMVLLALAAIVALLRELVGRGRELDTIRVALAVRPTPADADSGRLRQQLGEMIRTQFLGWGLTTSEQEVGWLLLKGLSLKEIAAVRSTSDKTVRQQASAVYQKAGVAGRAAFAAWFIEDYLMPAGTPAGTAAGEQRADAGTRAG